MVALVKDAKKQFTGNFALHISPFGDMAITPVNYRVQSMTCIDNAVSAEEDENTLYGWIFDAFNHNVNGDFSL